jgi:2-polyprenyl-3-methyl-5-hydroxy-6-metoxy-1,4-benzoquinol methylase
MPTPAELAKFYSETYYQSPVSASYSVEYDNTELAYKRLKARVLIELAMQHRPFARTFFDIGAGEGFLMRAAADRGLAVEGADFSTHGIRSFHPELLPQISEGDVFDVLERFSTAKRQFAACSAINVLEHVTDASRFMRLLKTILADEGIALITVPNDYSRLQMRLLEQGLIDREFWFAPPQHLHYFNSENLPTFCRSEGFDVLDLVGDHPIDLALFNPNSNYVMTPSTGKEAHRARMATELLIAEQGYDKYLTYGRGLASVGLGRGITVVLRSSQG